MSMKREFYKLSLVFIMIIFSFSIAFFLGREVSLSGEKQKKDSSLTTEQFHKESTDPVSQEEQNQPAKTENESKTLDSDPQTLLSTKATGDKEPKRKAEAPVKGNVKSEKDTEKDTEQDTSSSKVLYGLLINSYKKREMATEKAAQLKLRFPQWKFFFKRSKEVYKVYIGPFQKKESAEKFLKKIQEKPDFSSVKVEEI